MTDLLKNRMLASTQGFAPPNQGEQPSTSTSQPSTQGTGTNNQSVSGLLGKRKLAEQNGPTPQKSNAIVVTSTSGKKYTLTGEQVDWIRDRYKADWAGTYGYDDDDQQAKTYGRMSVAIRSTYGDSNVDRQLAGLKLPSEKYLEKYLEAYDNWHTGGVRQVFGNKVSDDAWTKIGELYRQDWVYEDTDEDQQRKSAGLMPSALAAKYSDTELDEDLMARGLPSYSELKTYTDRYSSYLGIDSFYRDVAGGWTNLRMKGWQNDDTEYTDKETGETHTGKYWYEKTFYDTLERLDNDGNKVYGSIYGLFKNNHKASETIASDEDYNLSRGKAIVGEGKADALEDDYAKYKAFSYDDFASKYEDYYARDYANLDVTLSNGGTMKASDYIAAVEAEAEKAKEANYFTVDHPATKDVNDATSVESFIERYQKDFPDRGYGRMFLDMKEHGVSDDIIKEAKRQVRKAAKTREEKSAIDAAWDEFSAKPRTPDGDISPVSRSTLDLLNTDMNVLASGIESYIQSYGGFTPENVQKALHHYKDIGVTELNIDRAKALVKERYAETGTPGEQMGEIMMSFDWNYDYKSQSKVNRNKKLAASAAAYIQSRRDSIANDGSVNRAMTEITDAIDRIGVGVTPDAMLSLAKGIADQPWASETTARRALVDLGFSMDGDFSGDALIWTKGWTDEQKTAFLNQLKSEMKSLDDVERKSVKVNFTNLDVQAMFGAPLNPISALGATSAVLNAFGRQDDGSYSVEGALTKAEDLLIDAFTKGDGVALDAGEYYILREWMDDMVASGKANEMECFNALCSMGYGDEIEAYDSEAFHEAIFKEHMVPSMFEHADSLDRAYWENASAEERRQIANDMWADMTPERQAEVFADYNWKTDPNIYRTAAQTFGQQFIAVVPSVATDIASGAIGFADMVATAVTGKDDLWEVTKKITAENEAVNRFGNVYDNVNGAALARITSDAASEMIKMYALGSIGGVAGEAFGRVTGLAEVASGSAGSAAVRKIAGLAVDLVQASPFVVSAMGNGFTEAKMMCASNGEATAYAIVTGTLEGVLEGMNFDNLWGKVLGQGSFGKMLIDGGNVWKNAGVVAKARIVNMLVAGLGEATEETASYLAETFWKTHSDWLGGTGWGKDTEWSFEDWVSQAGMGFLTGFLGAAIGAGNVNEVSIMQDYYENLGVIKGSIIDYSIAQKYWENATDAQREAWRNGAVQMLSLPDFANMMMQTDNCYRANAAADETYQQVVEKWDAKVSNLTAEMDAVKAQIMPLDPYNAEDAEKLAKLHTRMRGLQAQMKALQEQRTAAVAKAASDRDTRKDNAAAQLSILQSKYAEHYAALYLRNESAANGRDYDTLNTNHARARQNGDTVDLRAEAEAAAKNVTNRDNPIDAGKAAGYNSNINQEGIEDDGRAEGNEAAPGGYAGVSGPAGTVRNSIRQEGRTDGRTDSGWSQSVLLTDKAKSKGIDPVDLRADNNDPSSFYAAIGEAKKNNSHGAFVTQHEVAEYEGMKTFLNADGSVGVAVTADGNIVSVFKNDKTSTSKRAMSSILLTALENGGVKLDNFGSDALSNMYLQHGFIPVARTAFVDEFAPSDWNYERDGRPDIIFWVHNGDSADAVLEKIGTYERPDYDSIPMYEDYDAAEAARDAYLAEHPVQQAAQAQLANVRTLTDAEVAKVQQAVKDIKYSGEVVFIDDPNAADAWIDDDGTITINRANITGAVADELADNPGWWLLKHELTHFMEGTAEYNEFYGIVRRIIQRRLGDGYMDVLNDIKNDYAQYGQTLDNDSATRELVAKFMQSGELLSNEESIDMFVREQGSIADRIYNWIRYKINDLKLRRRKDSAVARDLLKAERLYAQAYRKANRQPGRDNGATGRQYAIKRTTDNTPFVQIDEDILSGVPEDQWKKTVFNEIRKRFRYGFTVNGQHVDVSRDSAKEFIRSKDVQRMSRENEEAYADKLRASANLDELTEASRDYVNELPRHERAGSITSFGRGKILFRSGSNDYQADILIGNRADGSLVFHDVTNVTPTSFTEAQEKQPAEPRNDFVANDRQGAASNHNVPSATESVKFQNRTLSTGQSWDELVKKYGAQPQGRNPRASDVRVPNQVNDRTRVSRLGRSLMESDKMTDDMRQTAKQRMVNEDWLSYIPKTNEQSMEEARAYIAARQPLAAQQEFHDMVIHGNFGRKTNAIGLQLLADASARGDVDSFYSIATDLQIAATEAGQSAQIFNVLKELKGVGSAYYMQRVVDKMNAKYDDLIQKGKMQKIVVSPVLMDQLAKATTVDQIAKAEEAVAKEIGEQLPLTWADRLSAWRYFSMLANPTTHLRNMTGNLLMAGLNTAKDAVATGLERGFVKDQSQRAHAVLTGADRNYWRGFVQQSYEEQARNLSGGGKLGFETFVKQNMRSFDTKWLNTLAKGNPDTNVKIPVLKQLLENGNFGLLEKEDIAFIRPAYQKALMEYMKAQGYTLNEDGQAGKVNAKGEFVEMSNAEKTSAVEWASQQAWKATFRDASALATLLNKVAQHDPVSRLVVEGLMPFKRTPVNIAKRGIEYSPIGIIMGTTQLLTSVKNGKMTAAQAVDNIASGITGTALMALGFFLAKAGHLRAAGEEKEKYETYLEDTGDQTYSLTFGDVSINMSAIAPATIPLFMGAALHDVAENGWDSFSLTDLTNMVEGALNPFMEMSFMSSINSALKTYGDNAVLGVAGNALRNYGSQYIPTIGGKIASAIDPTVRSTKSDATSPLGGKWDYFLRSLAKKTPGATYALEPDVDVWGRTAENDAFGEWALNFANSFILPTRIKITNRDAVDNELIRLVESTGSTNILPSDGDKYFTVKGKKYTMNAWQYTQYSRERGQASYAALKEIMRSDAYRQATDEERAAMLEKALKAAQKQVSTRWKEILGAFD